MRMYRQWRIVKGRVSGSGGSAPPHEGRGAMRAWSLESRVVFEGRWRMLLLDGARDGRCEVVGDGWLQIGEREWREREILYGACWCSGVRENERCRCRVGLCARELARAAAFCVVRGTNEGYNDRHALDALFRFCVLAWLGKAEGEARAKSRTVVGYWFIYVVALPLTAGQLAELEPRLAKTRALRPTPHSMLLRRLCLPPAHLLGSRGWHVLSQLSLIHI